MEHHTVMQVFVCTRRWASLYTTCGIWLGLREDVIDALRLRDGLGGFR
jgi:hypothetical protein